MNPWAKHLKLLLGTLGALLLIAVGLVVIANPYGNLAFSPMTHVLMDDNQRFQYPAVIRSRRYDSLVVGTSTSRLLEPAKLEAHFSGRFANLALNSGTAWEQAQVTNLFAREIAQPKTLIIGLDHVWCAYDADIKRTTPRGFPEWMFDDTPWNDFGYMLSSRTLEISGRRIWHALGRVKERWPHTGYEIFVPPESEYDLARARTHIYGTPGRAPDATAVTPTIQPAPRGAPVEPDRFPALSWLDEILSSKAFGRIILAFMPVHVATQPKPGQPAYVRENKCKAAIARIAALHDLRVIDFRIPSPITREDSNYWDALHYRVPIATRIVDDIAKALTTNADDPAGDWKVLRNGR